jgi:hypothetical protein
MDKEFIENYAGKHVKLTMIDDHVFEGLLWFVRYEDESETKVHSITLDSQVFEFLPEHIKKIEII